MNFLLSRDSNLPWTSQGWEASPSGTWLLLVWSACSQLLPGDVLPHSSIFFSPFFLLQHQNRIIASLHDDEVNSCIFISQLTSCVLANSSIILLALIEWWLLVSQGPLYLSQLVHPFSVLTVGSIVISLQLSLWAVHCGGKWLLGEGEGLYTCDLWSCNSRPDLYPNSCIPPMLQ